ncbi:MAG: hypothetical protein AMXMBFR26_00020 [Porticoccaceae bacterium]
MNRPYLVMAVALALVACGDADSQMSATATDATPTASPPAAESHPVQVASAAPASKAPPVPAQLDGRSAELSNPEHSAVILLYYGLAGIAPPIDKWVEADSRVQMAPAPQKAARRDEVRAELQAAAASVADVGVLRITLNDAGLSHYDPNYGEFQIGAVSPSSMVSYKAFGQNVNVKFVNGKTAQIWPMSAEDAQVVTDKLGPYGGRAELETELAITGVTPGPGGGTINTRIVEMTLRDGRTGMILGRLRP